MPCSEIDLFNVFREAHHSDHYFAFFYAVANSAVELCSVADDVVNLHDLPGENMYFKAEFYEILNHRLAHSSGTYKSYLLHGNFASCGDFGAIIPELRVL